MRCRLIEPIDGFVIDRLVDMPEARLDEDDMVLYLFNAEHSDKSLPLKYGLNFDNIVEGTWLACSRLQKRPRNAHSTARDVHETCNDLT